jgi:RimJ/RimL family protein N-acetyltransferase
VQHRQMCIRDRLGASCEAVLRSSFRKDGTNMDQMLWSILRNDWVVLNAKPAGRVH